MRRTWALAAVAVVVGIVLVLPAPQLSRRPSNFHWVSKPFFGRTVMEAGAAAATPDREEDEGIRPFRVHFDDKALQDLRESIATGHMLRSADRGGWTNGISSVYLNGLLNYWLSKYDWRVVEQQMNKWPQFKTDVDGLKIHFVHRKGERALGRPVVPVLLLHGWPGSFNDFHAVIDALANPTDNATAPVFDIVVPSLPGTVFSEAPARGDLGIYEQAVIFDQLMDRLKYTTYYVHGEGVGAYIGQAIAQLYPENVRGLHLTTFPGGVFGLPWLAWLHMGVGALAPSLAFPDEADRAKVYPLATKAAALLADNADMLMLTQRPDTLGVALLQSPLAATVWLVDKYHAWSDPRQGFTMSRDDIITTVTLYWLTESIGTSLRLFRNAWADYALDEGIRCSVSVPVGFMSTHNDVNPAEINKSCVSTIAPCFHVSEPGLSLMDTVPRVWASYKFTNLTTFTELGSAGRFLALEHPTTVVHDLRHFVHIVQTQRNRAS